MESTIELNKDNVRSRTRRYIIKNKIPLVCSVCGSTDDIEAHHESYNDYKRFVLFCTKHHGEHHVLNGDKKRWSSKMIKNIETLPVRIDADVRKEIQYIADKEGRTMAGQFRIIFEEWKRKRKGKG